MSSNFYTTKKVNKCVVCFKRLSNMDKNFKINDDSIDDDSINDIITDNKCISCIDKMILEKKNNIDYYQELNIYNDVEFFNAYNEYNYYLKMMNKEGIEWIEDKNWDENKAEEFEQEWKIMNM